MAFPLDANLYFSYNTGRYASGYCWPLVSLARVSRKLGQAKYGEEFIDCKAFPHLHPLGYGRWYHKCPILFNPHVEMRFYNVRGYYAADRLYPFFKQDYMLKVPLCMHEAHKIVKVLSLSEPLTEDRVSGQSDPYLVYGSEILRIIQSFGGFLV